MEDFHLGDILSITTGKLLSPEGMDGVYKILNYMTEDNLFTHQLPRAARQCAEPLLCQFPQLREVDAEEVNSENWEVWLANQVEKYGERLSVIPLLLTTHRDPINELFEMWSKKEGKDDKD